MSQDHIRVIRIYEFTGPRDVVEAQLAKSIQGEKALTNGLVIKAATLGLYPEIIQAPIPRTEVLIEEARGLKGWVIGMTDGTEHVYFRQGTEEGVQDISQATSFDSCEAALSYWRGITKADPKTLIRRWGRWGLVGVTCRNTLPRDEDLTTGILELIAQKEGSPTRYLAEQTDATIARFEGRWYSTTDPRRARHFYNKAEAVGVWEELCRRPLPSHLRGMTAGSFHNRAAIISLHEAQEKGE